MHGQRRAAAELFGAAVITLQRRPGELPGGEAATPSFVPPPLIRQLRDLTRCRVDLLAARTAEK